MTVTVITAPEPVVTLEEAKAHMRVEHDEDDLSITTYIEAAGYWLDGPSGWLGRAIGMQTLEVEFDDFSAWPGTYCPPRLYLPYPPLVSIVSVKYRDASNEEQTLDEAAYALKPRGWLEPAYGFYWPATPYGRGGVVVRYTAGYEPEKVPAPIRAAMMMLIAQWYDNRASVSPGEKPLQEMPFAVSALLAPYRVWS
jgi:uncharacterized phiE125 gp8 family phage protein